MASVVENGVTGFLFAAENRAAAEEATRRAAGLSDDALAAMSSRARSSVAERFTPSAELDAIEALLEAATAATG